MNWQKKFLNSYDPVTLETIKEDIVQTYGGDQLAKILGQPLDDQVHPYVAGVHEYESGSTDVGDVGYAAPTLNLNVSTCCISSNGTYLADDSPGGKRCWDIRDFWRQQSVGVKYHQDDGIARGDGGCQGGVCGEDREACITVRCRMM